MKAPGKMQRVTVNLPADLLKHAQQATGKGIAETIREGLQRVVATRPYQAPQSAAVKHPQAAFRKLWGKFPGFPSYEEMKRMR